MFNYLHMHSFPERAAKVTLVYEYDDWASETDGKM
jgi:hypothetical protein